MCGHRVIGDVSDLPMPLSCVCDVCEQSGVVEDERDCDLISSKYDYDNTFHNFGNSYIRC